MDAVLRTCDPPNILPPARIIKGHLTPRLDTDSSWGTPAPPANSSLWNSTVPSLRQRPGPHAAFGAGTPGDASAGRRSRLENANVSSGGANSEARGKKSKLNFGLKSFSVSFEDSDSAVAMSLYASKSMPACPAISGQSRAPAISRFRHRAGQKPKDRAQKPKRGAALLRQVVWNSTTINTLAIRALTAP